MSYPLEIANNATKFGYKTANLMFLKSCIEEFNVERATSIKSVIPEIKAISNDEINNYLIEKITDFNEIWKTFCDLQGKSETLYQNQKLF